jgi:phytoene synthase
MADEDDLDEQVRRTDPDRWLASRFIADGEARADVIALYGLNLELSRAAEVASQPLIGEMRLAWWREAVEEMFEGRPVRRHPTAQALAQAVRRRGLSRDGLEALIEARLRDLEPWPLRPDEVERYLDSTTGALMALAVHALSPDADPHAVRHAARAWGLAGLSRLGRLPQDWPVGQGVDQALRIAVGELRALPVAGFPAVVYATLARAYTRRAAPSELTRRLRLTWATATGRI